MFRDVTDLVRERFYYRRYHKRAQVPLAREARPSLKRSSAKEKDFGLFRHIVIGKNGYFNITLVGCLVKYSGSPGHSRPDLSYVPGLNGVKEETSGRREQRDVNEPA